MATEKIDYDQYGGMTGTDGSTLRVHTGTGPMLCETVVGVTVPRLTEYGLDAKSAWEKRRPS